MTEIRELLADAAGLSMDALPANELANQPEYVDHIERIDRLASIGERGGCRRKICAGPSRDDRSHLAPLEQDTDQGRCGLMEVRQLIDAAENGSHARL